MDRVSIYPVEKSVPPRWLRLKSAAEWSSIGQKRLVALAQSGDVVGFQDFDSGRSEWIFDRYSLDEYRERQASGAGDRAKVLKIMEGVR
jgi:hypothetical protein